MNKERILDFPLILQRFPLLKVLIKLFLAITAGIQFAADESYYKVTFLVHGIFATSACDVDAV